MEDKFNMVKLETLQDVMDYHSYKSNKYIYIDKYFDKRGIDYANFLKMKYDSINNGLIRDLYTIDGWYILWYLLSNSIKGEFINTTINIVSDETKIRPSKTRDILIHLQNNKIIMINQDISQKTKSKQESFKIKNNNIIHISVGYSNLNTNAESDGYTPIPTEFVKNVLPTLTPVEWGIYSILLVKYSYFLLFETIDEETGEIYYCYERNHYAFPTVETMALWLGVCKDTINNGLNKLYNNKNKLINKIKTQYSLVWDEEKQKNIVVGGNNRYKVKLLERIEYVYYYIYSYITEQQYKEFEQIKKLDYESIAKSSEQYKLKYKHYLYILNYYEYIMKQYKQHIDNNDEEGYKFLRNNYKIEP
jgi:hypothetical protein